jgi:thiamine transporter
LKKNKKVSLFAFFFALTVLLGNIKFSGFWPCGGSVSLFGMVPIVFTGIKLGPRFGVLLGLACGLFKLFFGPLGSIALNGFQFFVCVFLDYLCGYGVLGLGSVFCCRKLKKEFREVCLCIFVVFMLKFVVHLIAGVLVWGPLLKQARVVAVTLSIFYNASYLIPEMFLTMLGVCRLLASDWKRGTKLA